MATVKTLKAALRERVVGVSPLSQPLSDLQYSAGFNIVKEAGQIKYRDFIIPQLSSLLTSLLSIRTHISVLEIGPGLASVLGQLPDHMRRSIAEYTAFEPRELFATKLKESLCATASPLPGLVTSPIILNHPFTLDSKSSASTNVEKFDLVLFCHSMYGMNPKEAYIKRALKMVSKGGMVAVFHRDGSLRLENLKSNRATSFPTGVTSIEDDDEVLDAFAPFMAGFTLQDTAENKAATIEWRKVCRTLCRREQARPGQLIFDSPEIMATFTQHAITLPELESLVPLASPGRKVKSWEARLQKPASVMRPSNVQNVQQCVQWALKHEVGLTIVGGGHSGHCMWPDVVAIDMSAFNQVHLVTASVETASRGPLVVVESGCKSGDIICKTMEAGLTVALGARPSVGAGLWLQGGVGHLARMHGLACDNIIGAVMVSVATGHILRVGCVPDQHCPPDAVRPENESELLWALKGAGTNFGIIVSVTLTAHVAPIYTVRDWNTSLTYNIQLEDKLAEFDGLAQRLPRNYSTDAYLWHDGAKTQLGVTMFEASSADTACFDLSPVLPLVHSTLGSEQGFKKVDSMGLFETDMYMSGMHGGHGGGKTSSFKRCILLPRLQNRALLSELVEAFDARTSPFCYFHFLHGGGAVRVIKEEDSAFGCRGWEFACVITGVWSREQDGTAIAQATVQWVYNVVKDLEDWTLGVYGADLGPDPRDAALAVKAFGPNVKRLAILKRTMDPINVLAYACPLLER